MTLPINQIVCGDCLEVMKDWPDESINCCISSPPYWALRDYGVDGQLGLEKTFEEYIDKLCSYYDEVKRILRKDGTCWVNLGDTYNTHQAGNKVPCGLQQKTPQERAAKQNYERFTSSLPEKCLCLIPQRFAIEMVNRGWILRNVIIWSKPNSMPSSAKDRFTVDFEYVFFFVKSPRYFFEPQYEPFLTESNAERPRMGQGNQTKYHSKRGYGGGGTSFVGHSGNYDADGNLIGNPLGRNKRTTWIIPTQPTPEAHFATFPEDLVRPMVKAGCPRYVCKKCGKARTKIYNPTPEYKKLLEQQYKVSKAQEKITADKTGKFGSASRIETYFNNMPATTRQVIFKGYSDCGCGVGFRPGVMLDPFVGLAAPARWRPKRGWITSGLILRKSTLKNSQNQMFGRLKAA